MPPSSASGHGLDLWRRRLGSVQLPVLSAPDALGQILSDGTSLHAIAEALAADPPLALDVLLAAARLPAVDGDVRGVQHALNLLGIRKVQALVRARMERTLDPDNPAHRACLQAIEVSRFAASLVNHWEDPKSPGSGEFLSCLTLMFGLARARLPLAAPRVHAELERRVSAGERRPVVERALLGCDIQALNRAIILDTGLPANAPLLSEVELPAHVLAQAATLAWTGTMAPELPVEIARWLRQRTAPALIAYLLAWAAHDGWYDRRTERLLRVVSARANQPLDRVIADVHRSAAHMSRGLGAFAGLIFSPAEQLLWAPRKPRRLPAAQPSREPPARKAPPAPPTAPAATAQKNAHDPEPLIARAMADSSPARRGGTTPPSDAASAVGGRGGSDAGVTSPPRSAAVATAVSPSPAPENRDRGATGAAPGTSPRNTPQGAAAPAPRPDPVRIQDFVRFCRESRFRDLRQLMQQTGEVLDKGLMLRRSLLFLRPTGSEQMGCYLKHGYPPDRPVKALDLASQPKNLLERLLHQGGSLSVDASRVPSALGQLPESMHALVNPSGFVVTCVRMNDRSVGLIWADSGHPKHPVHPRQYEAFRSIGGHFNFAFTHLARSVRR